MHSVHHRSATKRYNLGFKKLLCKKIIPFFICRTYSEKRKEQKRTTDQLFPIDHCGLSSHIGPMYYYYYYKDLLGALSKIDQSAVQSLQKIIQHNKIHDKILKCKNIKKDRCMILSTHHTHTHTPLHCSHTVHYTQPIHPTHIIFNQT